MKYRSYLIKIIDRNNRLNYGLTMLEIRQTAREMYRRDHCTRYGF